MIEMLILKIMLNCLLRSIMIQVRYAWVPNSCVPVNHSKWQNRSVVECTARVWVLLLVGLCVWGLWVFGFVLFFLLTALKEQENNSLSVCCQSCSFQVALSMGGVHIHQNHTCGDPCICKMSGLVGNHSGPFWT